MCMCLTRVCLYRWQVGPRALFACAELGGRDSKSLPCGPRLSGPLFKPRSAQSLTAVHFWISGWDRWAVRTIRTSIRSQPSIVRSTAPVHWADRTVSSVGLIWAVRSRSNGMWLFRFGRVLCGPRARAIRSEINGARASTFILFGKTFYFSR